MSYQVNTCETWLGRLAMKEGGLQCSLQTTATARYAECAVCLGGVTFGESIVIVEIMSAWWGGVSGADL